MARQWLRPGAATHRAAGLLAALTVICLVGCGLHGHATSATTTHNPTRASTLSRTLVQPTTHPTNPYRLLSLTRKELTKDGFVLGTVSSDTRVKVTRRGAIKAANTNFPSRTAPTRVACVLIRYEALSKKLNPPHDRYVATWAVVWATSIEGLPAVHSTQDVSTWAVILINAHDDDLQMAFDRLGSRS